MTRLGALALIAALALVGCATQTMPLDQVFPVRIGDFLRTDGPNHDPGQNVDSATYHGADGEVLLRVRFVGKDQVARALDGMPLSATNVGQDPALGQRKGEFFDYGGQYHAAWGNGDWIFVVSAPTQSSRIAFLAGYGF